jgi:23S rRNA (cytidine1920-2'-O)/16S rRNA (cytidine1409-2'-O)-methyltransferase
MTNSEKMPLDIALVKKGLYTSRERAQAAIMAGIVFIDGQRVDKAGTKVPADATIEIQKDPVPFVSRGGLKLQKALAVFDLDVNGRTCLDAGASTGGFTDCLLQSGAKRVFSIDVGYGQLAWKLRNDPRVINMERTNIRYVTLENIEEPVDLITVDTSFISVTKFMTNLYSMLKSPGHLIILVKPQFEADRNKVGEKGVVIDPEVHVDVNMEIIRCARTCGLSFGGLTHSPITGPKGNIEYLGWFVKDGADDLDSPDRLVVQIRRTVLDAHQELL